MQPMSWRYNFDKEKDFVHKSRQSVICNNKDLNLRARNMKKDNLYKKYLKKTYSSDKCTACEEIGKEVVDDKYHLYKCEALKEDRRNMKEVMLAEINGKIKHGEEIKDFIWWFDTDDSEAEELEGMVNYNTLGNFEKKYGNRFYIPKELKKALKERGVEGDMDDLIENLQKIHIFYTHIMYKKKCKIHTAKFKTKKNMIDWVRNKNKRVIEKIKRKKSA